MSVAPAPHSPVGGTPANGRLTALRRTHPIRVLGWLRACILGTVAGAAVLCLLVPVQADQQRSALRRTDHSIADIMDAKRAAGAAAKALEAAFGAGEVALTGTGNDFANETARVGTYITSAAQGNAAGSRGLTQIQFVQAQLTICVQLANAAVRDAAEDRNTGLEQAATDALTDGREKFQNRSVSGTGGLEASLGDLQHLEEKVRGTQRDSFWLNPVATWVLLAGPAAVMLALVTVTAWIMARRFRSTPGRRVGIAILMAAAVPIVLGLLGGQETADLAAPQRAGNPLTLTLAVLLLAGAGLLAHWAYRPLLNEYRFRRS